MEVRRSTKAVGGRHPRAPPAPPIPAPAAMGGERVVRGVRHGGPRGVVGRRAARVVVGGEAGGGRRGGPLPGEARLPLGAPGEREAERDRDRLEPLELLLELRREKQEKFVIL